MSTFPGEVTGAFTAANPIRAVAREGVRLLPRIDCMPINGIVDRILMIRGRLKSCRSL